MNEHIYFLDQTQRAIARALVAELFKADGVVTRNETIYNTILERALQTDVVLTDDAYNLVSKHFTTPQHKFFLVSTLFTAAFMDGIAHPNEMKLIADLVAQLQIPADKLKQIMFWSQREALQINEALDFSL
ncbi:hypothetical protein [Psittacicella hinzii]|uniref:Tellurite resistance protein TerB n=1 Tax=Psittacicella hinzii TaxID=2028575 RepID=A0A3A1YEZ4_9GAMM|nr:hypothetical protein [Psittacicella hinzii]RIY35700.1 hypothetical protein CKF58_06580 [Psittacicella hinzii]